jgi:hypothetical protein
MALLSRHDNQKRRVTDWTVELIISLCFQNRPNEPYNSPGNACDLKLSTVYIFITLTFARLVVHQVTFTDSNTFFFEKKSNLRCGGSSKALRKHSLVLPLSSHCLWGFWSNSNSKVNTLQWLACKGPTTDKYTCQLNQVKSKLFFVKGLFVHYINLIWLQLTFLIWQAM